MAGFCTQCGRPLPDSGVCPFCTQAQVKVPEKIKDEEPSTFVVALKNLITLAVDSIKDPVKALKAFGEKRAFLSGIFMIVVTITLTFFATLVYALRCRHYQFAALPWLETAFVVPVMGYAFALGGTMLIHLVGKMRIDFKKIVAITGGMGLFPTALLAVGVLLTLCGDWMFYILFSAILVVAAVIFVVTMLRVYEIKLNLWQLLIIMGVLAIAYLSITANVSWFRSVAQYYRYANIYWQ